MAGYDIIQAFEKHRDIYFPGRIRANSADVPEPAEPPSDIVDPPVEPLQEETEEEIMPDGTAPQGDDGPPPEPEPN